MDAIAANESWQPMKQIENGRVNFVYHEFSLMHPDNWSKYVAAWDQLMRLPYWQRLWVVQEMLLA
jgi:hypothetical protein